jgi:hypothetical protein|nr:MAG TPA: hypothetical protein [Caudoviricetes sp.]
MAKDIVTKDNTTYISTDWLTIMHPHSKVDRFFIKSTQYAKKKEISKYKDLDTENKYLKIVVKDDKADFVNILGLSVNVLNGDIALGLNVKSDYIVIGNIKNMIQSAFSVKELPEYFDINYFLSLVKVDLSNTVDNIFNIVRDMYLNILQETDSKSIVYRIVREKSLLTSTDTFVMGVYNKLSEGCNPVISFMDLCVSLSCKLQAQATFFYGSFIENTSYDDIFDTYTYLFDGGYVDISTLLKTSKNNVDLLTLYYISIGIPMIYLSSLLSYGFLIRQRKIEYSSKPSIHKEVEYKRFLSNISNSLQSNNYVKDNTRSIIYNVIDIFICKGKFNLLSYAVENDNISMVSYLLGLLNLKDVLDDNNITVEWFSAVVLEYIRDIYPLIYNGSLYKKNMLYEQRNFIRVSLSKIYHVGKLVDDISVPLLSLFKKV